jgi:broad specificity phosphatase PhoE
MQRLTKSLLLIRHGRTELNDWLHKCPYGKPGFIDPPMWDTRLTALGVTQAEGLRAVLAEEHAREPIELLIASPLTRTLATASLAFSDLDVPCRVDADCAERRWMSGEVGRPPQQTAAEFPRFSDSLLQLPDEWWWEGDHEAANEAVAARIALQGGSKPLEGVALAVEPSVHFIERVHRFKRSLLNRPEGRIAVVTHWGVLHSLLGRSLRNCEMSVCTYNELLEPPSDPFPE